MGILIGNGNWLIRSNREAGDGFADIIVETEDIDSGRENVLAYGIAFGKKRCKVVAERMKYYYYYYYYYK